MSESIKPVRIFISSPGDVVEERETAIRVIKQLQRRYLNRFQLEPIAWEHLPLTADMPFQVAIDKIVESRSVDIAIFILWSRIGSKVTIGGHEYSSGTEREFDMMLRARQQSGDVSPQIIVYTRDDKMSFDQRLQNQTTEALKDLIDQKERLEAFKTEHFYDTENQQNRRAYHTYTAPSSFRSSVRGHLMQMLDELAGEYQGEALWKIEEQGAPFRGLDAFHYEHADVFFGREIESIEVYEAIQEQARKGCAFVLLSGASGTGKSSLARAGVMPAIVNMELDDRTVGWKPIAFTPGQYADDLIQGLAHELAIAVPDLYELDPDLTDLVESLKRDPTLAYNLLISRALKSLTNKQTGDPEIRVLLLVDQLEELFTDNRINLAEREQFIAVLHDLARSGGVWILATVRTDFYGYCEGMNQLMEMVGTGGHYSVRLPGVDALRRLITESARAAGLKYEKREGQSLDDVILEEASEHVELLPLLQYLLLELFQSRKDNQLTFSTYERYANYTQNGESLGGLRGALAIKAQQTFNRVNPEKSVFHEVMNGLITLSGDDDSAVRQIASYQDMVDTPSKQLLIDTFVEARLLTMMGNDGERQVTIAHESLLRVWDRAIQWVEDNRELLRVRAQLNQRMKLGGLMSKSEPLLEHSRVLLLNHSKALGDQVTQFIHESLASIDAHEKRIRKIRHTVIAVLSTLVVLASIAAVVAGLQYRSASTQRVLAEEREQLASDQKEIAQKEKERAELISEQLADSLNEASKRTHVLSLTSAAAYLNSNSPEQSLLSLEKTPVELRGWLWQYYKNQLDESLYTLTAGKLDPIGEDEIQPISHALLASDSLSDYVAVVFENNLKVFIPGTGEIVLEERHEKIIKDLAFAPNGDLYYITEEKLYVIARTEVGFSESQTVEHEAFNLALETHLKTLPDQKMEYQLFAIDLQHGVKVGITFSVKLSEEKSKHAVLNYQDDVINTQVLESPSEEGLLSILVASQRADLSHDAVVIHNSVMGVVSVWDPVTGVNRFSNDSPWDETFGSGAVNDCIYSLSGDIYVGTSWENNITRLSPPYESSTKITGHLYPVESLSLNSTLNLLASGDMEGIIKLHSTDKQAASISLYGHEQTIRDLLLTDRYLVSIDQVGQVKVWPTSYIISRLSGKDLLAEYYTRFHLKCEQENTLILFPAYESNGAIRSSLPVTPLKESEDSENSEDEFGPVLHTSTENNASYVRVLDITSGADLYPLEWHLRILPAGAYSSSQRLIAFAIADGSISVFTSAYHEFVTTLEKDNPEFNVISMCFSRDGKSLYALRASGDLEVWDIENGTFTLLAESVIEEKESWFRSPHMQMLNDSQIIVESKVINVKDGAIHSSVQGRWLTGEYLLKRSEGTFTIFHINAPDVPVFQVNRTESPLDALISSDQKLVYLKDAKFLRIYDRTSAEELAAIPSEATKMFLSKDGQSVGLLSSESYRVLSSQKTHFFQKHEATLDKAPEVITYALCMELLESWEAGNLRGLSTLSMAVAMGYKKAVKFLIAQGAYVEQTEAGFNALKYAALSRNWEMVNYLYSLGAPLQTNVDGSTALMFASASGDSKIVDFLLSHGAAEYESNQNWNALMVASDRGYVDIVQKLLDAGVDVNAVDQVKGWTALRAASYKGHEQTVKYLLMHGAAKSEGKDIWNALMVASNQGHVEVVKQLLDAGIDINSIDHVNGWTALRIASYSGRIEVVKYLLEKGAKYKGELYTPLVSASFGGHIEVLKYLLEHGCGVNDARADGMTPLIVAARYGELSLATYLLEQGADIDKKDVNGKTALDYATEYQQTAIIDLLKKKETNESE